MYPSEDNSQRKWLRSKQTHFCKSVWALLDMIIFHKALTDAMMGVSVWLCRRTKFLCSFTRLVQFTWVDCSQLCPKVFFFQTFECRICLVLAVSFGLVSCQRRTIEQKDEERESWLSSQRLKISCVFGSASLPQTTKDSTWKGYFSILLIESFGEKMLEL